MLLYRNKSTQVLLHRSKKTGGGTDTAYDQMMKARGNDMQKQGPPETPNFSSPY